MAKASFRQHSQLQPTPAYCSTELIRRLLGQIQAQTGVPLGEFRVLPFQSDDLADSGEKIVISEAGSGAALGLLVILEPGQSRLGPAHCRKRSQGA